MFQVQLSFVANLWNVYYYYYYYQITVAVTSLPLKY
jgi:hypothetical protein